MTISATVASRPGRGMGPVNHARSWSTWAFKSILVVSLVAGGLWTATRGVPWSEVIAVVRALRPAQLVTLAAIWLGGLGMYATVLSAALPGLGIRRSLLLNLSGSAVANVIPFGGAVATGVNWRMVRTWGHSNSRFATFCVLTNVLDVATKLVLPVVAALALAASAAHVPLALWLIAAGCVASLMTAGLVQALVFSSSTASPTFSASTGRAPSSRRAKGLAAARETVRLARGLLVLRWGRLLPASLGYVAAQVMLLEFSLRAVGVQGPLVVVLMAAAIERLTSLVPFTPGGAGFAEVGTIAWLVANGLDPVEVVAGVLVYRFFLVVMEVPLGGLLLGAWAWFQRSPQQAQEPVASTHIQP